MQHLFIVLFLFFSLHLVIRMVLPADVLIICIYATTLFHGFLFLFSVLVYVKQNMVIVFLVHHLENFIEESSENLENLLNPLNVKKHHSND